MDKKAPWHWSPRPRRLRVDPEDPARIDLRIAVWLLFRSPIENHEPT